MKRFVVSVALLLLALPALFFPEITAAQIVRSRPIDQATVRLIGVSGTERSSGHTGNQQRTIYAPTLSHGSGILIEPTLIATAAHVVDDMDLLFVRFVGDETVRAGVVVALDEANDVALVQVAPRATPTFPLPSEIPELTPGEILHITGYPLDARQNNPAAASGPLSRQNNEGALELAVSLNPGNSGGPVLNGEDTLVGIISARGRVDRGIQGIAIAVPISHVVSLRAQVVTRVVPEVPPSIDWLFDDEEEVTDAAIGNLPVLAALLAHREWRSMVARLLEFRVSNPWQLPQDVQAQMVTKEQRARRALRYAFGAQSVIEPYNLRELEAQLNAFNPASATQYSGSTSPAVSTDSASGLSPAASTGTGVPVSFTAGERLRVRVPPEAQFKDYGPLAFRLGIAWYDGLGVKLWFELEVFTSNYLDFIVGVGLTAGNINHTYDDPAFDPALGRHGCGLDGVCYARGILAGGMLATGLRIHGSGDHAPYAEVAWTPGYYFVDESYGEGLLGLRAAAGYFFGHWGVSLGYNLNEYSRRGASFLLHQVEVAVTVRL